MTTEAVSARDLRGGVAQTARWTAAARARESARPDRLFHDPYAQLLAGAEGERLLRHFHPEHAAAGGNPVLPIRTRWFDEFLLGAARPGIQLVGLGSGLDTRAYRLPWPAGTVLFELDQPDVLSDKDARLAGLAEGAVPRCRRVGVPVDLAGAGWPARLYEAGYRPGVASVWFGEGLLFYLSPEVAHRVLRQTAAACAPGSRLAVDLIGTGAFRLPYLRRFLRQLEQAGSPWRFGTDTPARFLASCGWRVDRVTEPGRGDANYGRWPVMAAQASAPNLPRSYLVVATR